VRIDIDKDLQGWRPSQGMTDKHGNLIEDRIYNQKDIDRSLVLEKRTELVAGKITEYLKATDPFAKTIVFCEDIDHAERMRQALTNLNAELAAERTRKYVMRITGDNAEGKAELDNFIDPESRYPVIATTSKLLTTGVDAKTCKLIVLDQNIKSMTEFKQIIGRGTRLQIEPPVVDRLPTIRRPPAAAKSRPSPAWPAHHLGAGRPTATTEPRRYVVGGSGHRLRGPRARAVPQRPGQAHHREPARLHPHQPHAPLRLARQVPAGLERRRPQGRAASELEGQGVLIEALADEVGRRTSTRSTCCCTWPGTCRRSPGASGPTAQEAQRVHPVRPGGPQGD
jgi:hypothetical protein